ncbi:uncharacterized protein PRCAT00000599001 [Priceomyces carsonii]|uniref:uncharacterized protein n=1 Tax=Priceomyces carsonii TaxID=28549 RepID=UPI002EDA01C5|nr:unnamed protein product [Priceomyces carsonii]
MSSSTFSQIRSQALNLEKQTDALLSRYSKFQNLNNSTSPDEEEIELHESIKQILERRDLIINKLNRISDSDADLSTSKLQQLQRHKEILNEHKRSYLKIESAIDEERNRTNLLFSVRSDINAHKQRVTNSDYSNQLNANDYVLEESLRVDNANSFADRLLNLAYQTRDEILNQRQYLANAQTRMLSTLQTIPGINVIISKINTRRKRDTLILATVISICIIFIFFMT